MDVPEIRGRGSARTSRGSRRGGAATRFDASRYQYHFLDGVLCGATTAGLDWETAAGAVVSRAHNIGVEGQVFTIVNQGAGSDAVRPTWDVLNGWDRQSATDVALGPARELFLSRQGPRTVRALADHGLSASQSRRRRDPPSLDDIPFRPSPPPRK